MSTKKRRSMSDLIDEYFEDVEKRMKRLSETLVERPSWNQKACTMEPLRDMMITPTEVVVTVDLPYTEENTIQVKPIDENILEISAKMKRKIRFDELGITHHKGEFQKFHCQMQIPVPVHADEMKMRFKKGILEIRLPRQSEYAIPVE